MCGRRTIRRRAQTLLELVAATTIIAMTLVPTLRMMRDSLRVGRSTELSNNLATLAASKLEEHLLLTSGTWSPTTVTGSFAAEGYATVKFRVVRSDSAVDGGSTGVLMSITATVWEDTDNDNNLDASEIRSVFASKLARCVSYEYEAAGA